MGKSTKKELLFKINFYGLRLLYSFVRNCLYWCSPKNLRNLKNSLYEMSVDEKIMRTNFTPASIIDKFIWRSDTLGDWSPWIVTLYNNNFVDDCDGAAKWAKWLFSKKGVKSRLVALLDSSGGGHMICVENSNRVFTSNDRYVIIGDPENWEECVLKYHNYKYDIIVEL